MTSFFFPHLKSCVTNPKIRDYIQNTNAELLEKGQNTNVIKKLVEEAHVFFEKNLDVLEGLLQNLKDE